MAKQAAKTGGRRSSGSPSGRSRRRDAERPQRPSSALLAGATALAVASALWALFQWSQLLLARSGGETLCAFAGQDACARAWDLPLARTVEQLSAVPVAGWGLAWSLAAFALPLLALSRRASGRSAEPFVSASWLTAAAGLVVVLLLAGALVLRGLFCATCVLTYLLVAGYAALLLGGGRLRSLTRGAPVALAGLVLAFLAVLYPGLRTPRAPGLEIARPAPRPHSPLPAMSSSAAGNLEAVLRELSPSSRQSLADALERYRSAPALPLRPARGLLGPANAPVRITDFSDALCGHCAELHRVFAELRRVAPVESFALESRQFPLDGACNPGVESRKHPERCIAARARICMEGLPGAFDFSTALFEAQHELSEARILAAASPHLEPGRMAECLASESSRQRLLDDIAWAEEHGIRGTPLVLVNGRRAPALPALLYGLVLAGGDAGHPAFAALPPPRSAATP